MEEYDVDNWELTKTMVSRGWHDNWLFGGGTRIANAMLPSLYTDNIMEDFSQKSFEEQYQKLVAVHEFNKATYEERQVIQTGRIDAEHQEELKRLGVDYEKLSAIEKTLYVGGYLVGAAADPLLLMPVGVGMKVVQAGAKGAQLVGKAKYLGSAAAIGAVDGVLRAGVLDHVEDGTLNNFEDIASGGAWGAAAGAALGLWGVAWKSVKIRRMNKAAAGQDIDKVDINAALKDASSQGEISPWANDPDFITQSLRAMTSNMATEEELLARGVIGSYVNRGAQDSYKRFMSRYAAQEAMSPQEMLDFLSGKGHKNYTLDEVGDEFIEFEAKLLHEVSEGALAGLIKDMSPKEVQRMHASIDSFAQRVESTADFLGHSAVKFSTKNVDEAIGELNFFREAAVARVMDDINYNKAVEDIADQRNIPLKPADPRGVTQGFKQAEAARAVKAETVNPQRWAYRYANDPDRTYHTVPTKASTTAAYKDKALQDSVEALQVKWANRTPWAGRDFGTDYMKQSDLDKLASYLEKETASAAQSARPEIPDAPWVHPEPTRPWKSMADTPDPREYGDPAPVKFLDEAHDEITTELADAMKKQAGRASANLLQTLGLGTAGALTGYQTGGTIDSALMGAFLFAGSGWALRKMFGRVRAEGGKVASNEAIGNKAKMSPEENNARQVLNFSDGLARTLQRGHKVISSWGPTGIAAVDKLRRFDSSVTMATSRAVHSLVKVANKAGMSQKDLAANTNIINYMTRKVGPGALTKAELAVAKELDRLTMHILDLHKKVGAMTPDQYREILADRKRRGFWPIVMNEGYLFTSAGKKQWYDTFENTKWSKSELEAAMKTLIGEQHGSEDILKSISRQMIDDGSGRVSLSNAGAKELLQRKILTPFSVIHSDARQDLLDGILRPFMISDPVNAFQDFINFSYRKIAEHKAFGGYVVKRGKKVYDKHAYIINTADQILAETGSVQAKRYFLEQMYTAVGSMKSEIIRKTATQNRTAQAIYGKMKALNILKLGTVAIVNAPHAIVAGTIRLAKYKNKTPVIGLFKSFGEAVSGYVKALPKEARMEVLGRTGAALETTRMQYIGEMAAMSHNIFPVNAGIFQWLNNPTKFLQVVAHNWTEEVNRGAGANMGRAYAEDLISKKIKIEAGVIKDQKTIDDIYAQMDELGLPTRDKYSGVEPIHYQTHVDRAGLFFSDAINFSNKTQNLPLAAQTPFAKMLLQFKTFQYHWGNFIWEHLIPKKGKGNINSLIAFMAGPGALMGMTADEVRRFVMADDREFTMTERWLRGLGTIGGMGLWSSAIESLYNDPTRPYELIAGPTISTMVKSVQGVGDVMTGRDTLGEQAIDAIEYTLPLSKAITRRVE